MANIIIDKVPQKSTYRDKNRSDLSASITTAPINEKLMKDLYESSKKVFENKTVKNEYDKNDTQIQKIIENCVPIYPVQIMSNNKYFAGKYIFSGKYTENGKIPLVWYQKDNEYTLISLGDACQTGVMCWTFNEHYANVLANALNRHYKI